MDQFRKNPRSGCTVLDDERLSSDDQRRRSSQQLIWATLHRYDNGLGTQSGRVGLGVSIFSYNGRIWLGVSTDQGLVNNPERIVENFLEELHLLGAQAMLRSRPLEDVLQLPPFDLATRRANVGSND